MAVLTPVRGTPAVGPPDASPNVRGRWPGPYHRWLPGRPVAARPPPRRPPTAHPPCSCPPPRSPTSSSSSSLAPAIAPPSTSSSAATTAGCAGLAYKLMADRHRMDDALQEAYLKAYRASRRFRPGSDFGTWLYRITYNACIDELRKRKRSPVVHRRTPSTRCPAARARSGSSAPSETVRGALADLPVDQRVTVVLVDGEGFDHREAAKILGVAPGTVASRLHRARAALRRILGEEVR